MASSRTRLHAGSASLWRSSRHTARGRREGIRASGAAGGGAAIAWPRSDRGVWLRKEA